MAALVFLDNVNYNHYKKVDSSHIVYRDTLNSRRITIVEGEKTADMGSLDKREIKISTKLLICYN